MPSVVVVATTPLGVSALWPGHRRVNGRWGTQKPELIKVNTG